MLLYLIIMFFIILFGAHSTKSKIEELEFEITSFKDQDKIDKNEKLIKKHRAGLKISKATLAFIILAAVILRCPPLFGQ